MNHTTVKTCFAISILLLCAMVHLSCGETQLTESVPLPDSTARIAEIWRYASGMNIEKYVTRRFGGISDGLRRAVNKNRIDFFTTGSIIGAKADLKCFLFFEYRRHKTIGNTAALQKPDEKTERYIRAIISKLNSPEE